MNVGVLLLAAGQGRRMGGDVPKQYRMVEGKPLLRWALESLALEPRFSVVQPVIAEDDRRYAEAAADPAFPFMLHLGRMKTEGATFYTASFHRDAV